MKKPYRKRYILFEIISDSKFRENLIEIAIKNAIKELFGVFGLSEANPKLLTEFSKGNTHVLQVDHRYVQKAKVAMATIKEINKKPIIFKTIRVYGTLKKIKEVIKWQK